MSFNILYFMLAFYGLLALAANAVGLWKFGPDAWGIFQTAGGAAFLILALLGVANRLGGRWIWSVVAVLVATDICWRLLS
jgi:hypothetical protein